MTLTSENCARASQRPCGNVPIRVHRKAIMRLRIRTRTEEHCPREIDSRIDCQ
jgi:hypothetical protein